MHETQSRLAARRVCVLWLLLFLLLLFVFAAFVVVLFCLFVVLLGVGEGVQADLEQQFNGVEGLLAVPRRRKSARLGGQQRVNELAVVHLEMLWWCCFGGGSTHRTSTLSEAAGCTGYADACTEQPGGDEGLKPHSAERMSLGQFRGGTQGI